MAMNVDVCGNGWRIALLIDGSIESYVLCTCSFVPAMSDVIGYGSCRYVCWV